MTNQENGEGRSTSQQLQAARQTVRLCSGLSRLELARTVCEHWGWVTASGSYQVTACLKVLEDLEQQGLLQLPPKRQMTRWSTDPASGAVPTPRTQPGTPLAGGLSEVGWVGLWAAAAGKLRGPREVLWEVLPSGGLDQAGGDGGPGAVPRRSPLPEHAQADLGQSAGR
jgi:hypothetical protein